jgi:hypothetical protein
LARKLASEPDSPKYSGNLRLGFVILPSDIKSIGFKEVLWSDTDLAAADRCTREIIQQIQNDDFWPPTDPPPVFSEWAAAICLDNVLDRNFLVE